MQKKKYALIALLLGVVGLGGVATLGSSHTQQDSVMGIQTSVPPPTLVAEPSPTLTPIPSPTDTPVPTLYIAPTEQPQVNTDPPAVVQNDPVPAGATAQCGDGTYSYSQHRSGTCSHHGGVAQWL